MAKEATRQRIQEELDQYVATGKARYVRVSARKARLVADLVRGKTVGEAMGILQFTNRPSAAPHVLKLLKTVVAAAEQSEWSGDPDDLIVAKINVDEGPTMKRIQPRAMGRAFRIMKRSCHITLYLAEEE